MPGVSVTATSPALQGPRSTTTDAQGLYVIRALPPGEYQVRFELSGFGTVNRTSTVPLGLVVVQRRVDAPRRRRRNGAGHGRSAGADCDAGRRHQLQAAKRSSAGDAADASGHRAALARRQTRISPNVEPAGHQRRVRVRQRVHDQRRRRQRQPVRDAAESLHRGRDRGDAGADVRHLGGIRPVHRRRGQRDHQERRQQFFRQRPDQFPEQRSGRHETPFEECVNKDVVTCSAPSNHLDKLSKTYEGTFGGPVVRDRLWFFLSGRHQFTESQSTLQQTGIVVPTTDSNKRGEIKITGTVVNNHTLQWRVLERPAQAHQQLRPPVLHHRSAQRGRSGEPELVLLCQLQGRAGKQRARRSPVLGAALSIQGRRRHEHEPRRFAVSLPDLRVPLQRPVFRCDRSGGSRQQADHREHHELLEQGRPARNQVRLRVLPQPADGRQFAVVHRLRVQRGLPDRRRRHACARFNRPSDSGIRGGRIVCRELARDARRDDEHGQSFLLRAGPLGAQRPLVVRSRRAVRAGECPLQPGRHHEHRRRPHRASSRFGVRRQRQWQPHPALHVRPVFRPVQRSADWGQQPGGQSSVHPDELHRSQRSRLRVRAGNESRQLSDCGGERPAPERHSR